MCLIFFCSFYHSMSACVCLRERPCILCFASCVLRSFVRHCCLYTSRHFFVFFFAAFDSVFIFVLSLCVEVCVTLRRASFCFLVSLCVCRLALFFSSGSFLLLSPPLLGLHLPLFLVVNTLGFLPLPSRRHPLGPHQACSYQRCHRRVSREVCIYPCRLGRRVFSFLFCFTPLF